MLDKWDNWKYGFNPEQPSVGDYIQIEGRQYEETLDPRFPEVKKSEGLVIASAWDGVILENDDPRNTPPYKVFRWRRRIEVIETPSEISYKLEEPIEC